MEGIITPELKRISITWKHPNSSTTNIKLEIEPSTKKNNGNCVLVLLRLPSI
jgi:hypothetical protein